MYQYDEFDSAYVAERVEHFRDQVARRVSGALTEEEFKPLRLQNGLYLQLHAYMLRIAIPYGTLSSEQMRTLARIARRWDKGYGHFTTRQNIQFNWIALRDAPDILQDLSEAGLHAIQTSGNCIRNITADHFAGAATDEIEDPRITAEILRQWSTDHPEFLYLPRKFKIAVTGSRNDRAVIGAHDIGLRLVANEHAEIGYEVIVGGGLGRTPVVGQVIRDFLPFDYLLPYMEALLRVYNAEGRRDNKYKARIKILVKALGLDVFRTRVEAEFEKHLQAGSTEIVGINAAQESRIRTFFNPPEFDSNTDLSDFEKALYDNPFFRQWTERSLHPHKQNNHTIVTISLKAIGDIPGDASATQMEAIASLARQYSYDEIRITHEQNVVLPHVHKNNLPAVYAALRKAKLHTANVGLISDIIACPGMDYCTLATARSIPVAQEIARHFADQAYAETIGEMKIKISGCINSCAHHHVAHIGILGLEKGGIENYQITLGGDHRENLTLGQRVGPGINREDVVPAIERLIQVYLELRDSPNETFLMAYRRLGMDPFKSALYDKTLEHNVA